MGYAGEAQTAAVDYRDRGRDVPKNSVGTLADMTERGHGIANEIAELVSRAHVLVDRMLGPAPESTVVGRGPTLGALKGISRQTEAGLDQLRGAINHCGQSIEPLRALVSRLEAL